MQTPIITYVSGKKKDKARDKVLSCPFLQGRRKSKKDKSILRYKSEEKGIERKAGKSQRITFAADKQL